MQAYLRLFPLIGASLPTKLGVCRFWILTDLRQFILQFVTAPMK